MTGAQQHPPHSREELLALLSRPVEDLGLDLEDVEVTTAGKRRLLRVAVDRDGGVSMDDVADATRAISGVLDDTDSMGAAAYTLEVGSPGVGRPLTLPRHWRRSTDRLVKVRLADGETLTGRVVSTDDDATGSARLDVAGTEREVTYDDVARASVQVEFTSKEK